MLRRLMDITMLMVMTALSAGWLQDNVQDFRAFQAANPDSDFGAYLVALGWPVLTGVLIGIGAIALVIWWTRNPTAGEDEGGSATVSAGPSVQARVLGVAAIAVGVWIGLQDWPEGILLIGGVMILFVGWLIGPDPNDDSAPPQKHGSH